MLTILGPLGRWELVGGARKPWVYVVRVVYALALLVAIGFGWPQGEISNAEAARVGYRLSHMLIALHAIVLWVGTPLWIADLVASARRVGRLDLLLTTRLQDDDIVVGSLFGRLAGLALLCFGGLPALALAGLLGGFDYGLLFTTFWLTALTLVYCGCLTVYYSVLAAENGRVVATTLTRMFVLSCLPGGSPVWLWLAMFSGLPLRLDNLIVWWCIAFSSALAAVFLAGAVNNLRDPKQARSGIITGRRGPVARVGADFFRGCCCAGILPLGCAAPWMLVVVAHLVGGNDAFDFITRFVNIVCAPVLLAAIHQAVGAACLNSWMDRREGQLDLVLATAMDRFDILVQLVGRRPAMKKAILLVNASGMILLLTSLSAHDVIRAAAASVGIWIVSLSLVAFAAAAGTLMMVIGQSQRGAQAAAWGMLLALCVLPLLAQFDALWLWAAVATIVLVFVFAGSRTAVTQSVAATALFVGVASAWAIAARLFHGHAEAAPTLSPLLWILKLMEVRTSEGLTARLWPTPTGRWGSEDFWIATLATSVLSAPFAAAACWHYVWNRFDWLVDRPRKR